MIFDLNLSSNFKDKENRYDFVIIGAGAAGITIAKKLMDYGKKIALVEAGGEDYSEESQDCYKGEVLGDPYFDLDYSRLRFFGGSTNHWSGWCRSFEEIDFKRGYLGDEYVWPLKFDEINKYKKEACEILEIKNNFNDLNQDSNIKRIEFQFSPPVLFKEKYFDILKKSKDISVFINSTLIDITGSNNIVTSANFKSFTGNKISINGKNFIFALGGIENSRYLLWIREKYRDKFFNSKLPIGKYWMEHPHFTLGRAIIDKRKIDGNYYSLSPDAQIKSNIFNCGFRVEHTNASGTKAMIKEIMCLAPNLGKKLVKLSGRNLVCGAKFRAAWEQAPNHKNYIDLSANRDMFGIPRVVLNWKKFEIDRKTIDKSVEVFNNWLMDIDGGRLQLSEWMIKNYNYPEDDELAGNHHMGGTRMHENHIYGVVDKNCKVHGSDNIYIAGSSIFTTGGHNNPTLPIVQFSLKLADYLNTKL